MDATLMLTARRAAALLVAVVVTIGLTWAAPVAATEAEAPAETTGTAEAEGGAEATGTAEEATTEEGGAGGEEEREKIELPSTQRDRVGLILVAAMIVAGLLALWNARKQLRGERKQASGEWRWR